MKVLLVAAAFAWPALLGSVLWRGADGAPPPWTAVVYVAASRLCHQLPTRSFHTDGVRWPVCARCSGLYAAAPVGALLAILPSRRRRRRLLPGLVFFGLAAIPTALTLAIERSGLSPLSNAIRAVAALPLGAAIAYLIVDVVDRPAQAIR
jgi:uncharacterized membrane protein